MGVTNKLLKFINVTYVFKICELQQLLKRTCKEITDGEIDEYILYMVNKSILDKGLITEEYPIVNSIKEKIDKHLANTDYDVERLISKVVYPYIINYINPDSYFVDYYIKDQMLVLTFKSSDRRD